MKYWEIVYCEEDTLEEEILGVFKGFEDDEESKSFGYDASSKLQDRSCDRYDYIDWWIDVEEISEEEYNKHIDLSCDKLLDSWNYSEYKIKLKESQDKMYREYYEENKDSINGHILKDAHYNLIYSNGTAEGFVRIENITEDDFLRLKEWLNK